MTGSWLFTPALGYDGFVDGILQFFDFCIPNVIDGAIHEELISQSFC